jgi:ATP-dependent DNA helicase UvrD/PcrA
MGIQEVVRNALADRIFKPKVYESLKQLILLLDDIREMKPNDALTEVIERVKYLDYLQEYSISQSMDYTSKLENIEQLIYAAKLKDSLFDYLEEAALIREDKAEEDEDVGFGVNLSTVHAAKGLEFQVVFVVGCEEQLFPHWRSMESEAELEEERRLMYVSITRAEQFLYLSSASYRKGQFNLRSRFIDEVETSLAEH